MRKYFKFIIALALFAAATSTCKKKDTDPELSASVSSLSFAAAGESKSFDVQSNVEWAVSGQPAWLTVSPASGKGPGKVTATAQPNTTTEQRTTQLSITVKGLPSVPVNVSQQGAAVEPAFVAVTGITGVPATAVVGDPLTLSGTVTPSNATNRTIAWSVQNTGGTGAGISGGNTLNTAAAGTVTVRATIVSGASATTNYTQDFDVTVSGTALFSGKGTSDDPYLIPTAAKLAEMRDLVNAGTAPYANAGIYWRLGNDIALSGNWTPIGVYTSASGLAVFRGNFDGAGKTITGLVINRPEEGYNGLFGRITEGTVKNMGLKDVHITGLSYNGGIAGSISCGVVTGCFVSGTIAGGNASNAEYHGGIAGRISGGTISNCYTAGAFSGQYTVGGIAGEINYGVTYDAEYNMTNHGTTLANCYSTAAISAYNTAGGIQDGFRAALQALM